MAGLKLHEKLAIAAHTLRSLDETSRKLAYALELASQIRWSLRYSLDPDRTPENKQSLIDSALRDIDRLMEQLQ